MRIKNLFIPVLITTILWISCDQDEATDRFGINRNKVMSINAMVVETQAGWMMLSERHGFLEFLTNLHDSIRIDGMMVRADVFVGNTYFDDSEGTLDDDTWDRNFTYAELVTLEEASDLYSGTKPPVLEIFWAPDYEDFEGQIPDGYGYYVQAKTGGFKIRQTGFPAIPGTGSFKSEVEASKVGMYVMYLLMTSNYLPHTGRTELDFLKIDHYEYIPIVP